MYVLNMTQYKISEICLKIHKRKENHAIRIDCVSDQYWYSHDSISQKLDENRLFYLFLSICSLDCIPAAALQVTTLCCEKYTTTNIRRYLFTRHFLRRFNCNASRSFHLCILANPFNLYWRIMPQAAPNRHHPHHLRKRRDDGGAFI